MNVVDTVYLLNKLIMTAKNGESTLRAAAEEAHHPELKTSLYEDSAFFGHAAEELQAAVRRLGGEPRELGSFDNTLHRTWMHLKSTAFGRDEDMLLDMLDADEAQAEREFARAASEDTGPEIHAMLERQYAGTRQRHGELRIWRQQLQH